MYGLFKIIQNYVNNKINKFFSFLTMCFYRLSFNLDLREKYMFLLILELQ